MIKKLNMDSMKSIIAALVVLSLTTISCTKSDEDLSNQSEIETRRGGNKGGGTTTGDTNNSDIPQPTGFTATATGSTQVSLAWNSVAGATSYWIYRDSYVPAIVTTTSYTDRSVSPGTTYTYAVAAVVNSTLGAKSASVTVTTPR